MSSLITKLFKVTLAIENRMCAYLKGVLCVDDITHCLLSEVGIGQL